MNMSKKKFNKKVLNLILCLYIYNRNNNLKNKVMKKSEVIESFKRVLDSLKKEYEYNQKNFKMIDIYNPDFRLSMILLSEKINTLEHTILDIIRIHSLD